MNKLKLLFQRFRASIRKNSVTIGVVVVVVAAGTILFFQTLALSKLESDLDNQQQLLTATNNIAASLDKNSNDRTQQIAQLNKHLDCIVLFFTNSDRANKTIADIDTCTLKSDETVQQAVPQVIPVVPNLTQQPAPQTTTPLAPSTPKPNQQGILKQVFTNPIKKVLDFLF